MPKQVLIINITRMGDLIQMIPLLSRLEEEWPGVAIDLIVDREFAHVASLIPGIRQVLPFDFQRLMDESRVRARDVVALYQDLAGWAQPLLQVGYDRVVNLTFNRWVCRRARNDHGPGWEFHREKFLDEIFRGFSRVSAVESIQYC